MNRNDTPGIQLNTVNGCLALILFLSIQYPVPVPAQTYQWEDASGPHFTDDPARVPVQYRSKQARSPIPIATKSQDQLSPFDTDWFGKYIRFTPPEGYIGAFFRDGEKSEMIYKLRHTGSQSRRRAVGDRSGGITLSATTRYGSPYFRSTDALMNHWRADIFPQRLDMLTSVRSTAEKPLLSLKPSETPFLVCGILPPTTPGHTKSLAKVFALRSGSQPGRNSSCRALTHQSVRSGLDSDGK